MSYCGGFATKLATFSTFMQARPGGECGFPLYLPKSTVRRNGNSGAMVKRMKYVPA